MHACACVRVCVRACVHARVYSFICLPACLLALVCTRGATHLGNKLVKDSLLNEKAGARAADLCGDQTPSIHAKLLEVNANGRHKPNAVQHRHKYTDTETDTETRPRTPTHAAAGRRTDLSLVEEDCVDNTLNGGVEVSVVKDNDG